MKVFSNNKPYQALGMEVKHLTLKKIREVHTYIS